MNVIMKVGDVVKIPYEESCNILFRCGELVMLDPTLSIMEKEHAKLKLYHAQCHIMLEQYNIGEY